ncbi:MAG: flippase [Acetatifactor sp.]
MGKAKEPSLKVNMLLNMVKSLMGVLFPLITFPYITRVLGTENLGKFNFAQSIVSYFILFAGLGISTYAVREGAKVRKDKRKIEKFSNEVYTINMVATIISYVFMFVALVFVTKLFSYRILIVILSVQIICKTIGFEWIYSVYEDFLFITIRSISFQFLSLCLLFLMVKNASDLYTYTVVVVVASSGNEIVNHFYAKKYCRIHLSSEPNLRKHVKPILTLFAMSAAVMIYVNLDTTMLGFMCDDYTVGMYSVSVKVYTILKTVISAALLVFIPRISLHVERKDLNEVNTVSTEAYNILFTLLLPIAVGIFLLRKEVVVILAGVEYMSATTSLAILCGSLVFCLLAGYWSQAVLIPFREEKKVLVATLLSALVNVVLNFVLIPVWKENAAALTTLVSELVAFVYCYLYAKKLVEIKAYYMNMLKVVLGCIGIICFYYFVCMIDPTPVLKMIIVIVGSIVTYFVIEMVTNNPAVKNILKMVKGKRIG